MAKAKSVAKVSARARAESKATSEPKRARGRPPRGEGSSVLGTTIDGKREGVRASTSQGDDIKLAAELAGVSVSTLLRRCALVFARDAIGAHNIRNSAVWKADES